MAAQDLYWDGALSGSEGEWFEVQNWQPIPLPTTVYRWIVSGSGTSEYRLDLLAGGNPGVGEPSRVIQDGTAMTEATVGSLEGGEWDWGDNDSLGYSTIYVRLTDSVDPDTKHNNFLTFQRVPIAADKIYVPPGSSTINGAVVSEGSGFGKIHFQAGHTAQTGSPDRFLEIALTVSAGFIFESKGRAYIKPSFASGTNQLDIYSTQQGSNGRAGLYLNISDSDISTVNLWSGVTNIIGSSGVALNVRGDAKVRIGEDNGFTTINSWGRTVCNQGTTITNVNAKGAGIIDFTQDSTARTVTNSDVEKGAIIKLDPAVVTLTNVTTGVQEIKGS